MDLVETSRWPGVGGIGHVTGGRNCLIFSLLSDFLDMTNGSFVIFGEMTICEISKRWIVSKRCTSVQRLLLVSGAGLEAQTQMSGG